MAGITMSPGFRDQVVETVKVVRGIPRGHDPIKQGRLQQETRYQGYFLTTLEALGENDTAPPVADFEVYQVNHDDLKLYATGYIIEVVNRQCDLTITPSDLSRVEMHDGEWRPYVWEDHSLCSGSSGSSGSGSGSGSGGGGGGGGSSSSGSGSGGGSTSGSGSGSSSSSSSSSSCSHCYCWLPTSTISGGWPTYADGSLDSSTTHESTDEGVDSSDDAATAIRPPTVSPGRVVLHLSADGDDTILNEPDFIPSSWTQITGVTARIRAKVVEYGETTPTDQVVEVKVGDDGNAEEAGECTFTISGTNYQTYEENVTGGRTLPCNVTAIDWDDFVSRWEMSEARKSETSLEISAIEVCVEGG